MNDGDSEDDWDPFQGEGTPEEELWFLPGPDLEQDDVPPGSAPLPRTNHASLFDIAMWHRAQESLSGELARLTQLFGELDARLRMAPVGHLHRLALLEVVDISWWTGDRVPVDQLGLWLGLQVDSHNETGKELARAAWAVRRLTSSLDPASGLELFLGRRRGPHQEGEPSRVGGGAGAVDDLEDVLSSVAELHPVVQAAVLFQAWRLLGQDRTRDFEAAVLASRHAATMSRIPGQGALFLPLVFSGPGAFRGQGDPEHKFAAWLAGAEQATLAALLHLDLIETWKQRAEDAISDLSGRTPKRLVRVVANWPHITASLAEGETGTSRATVQRNLDLFAARGLIREITGQGRYRVWAAKL